MGIPLNFILMEQYLIPAIFLTSYLKVIAGELRRYFTVTKDNHRLDGLQPQCKIGDLYEVVAYDQGDCRWEYGVILITEVHDSAAYKGGWAYYIEAISGTIKWTAVGIGHFQDESSHLKKKYLGNVNTDKALRILYGKKET